MYLRQVKLTDYPLEAGSRLPTSSEPIKRKTHVRTMKATEIPVVEIEDHKPEIKDFQITIREI